jgi:hypothetical protein
MVKPIKFNANKTVIKTHKNPRPKRREKRNKQQMRIVFFEFIVVFLLHTINEGK